MTPQLFVISNPSCHAKFFCFILSLPLTIQEAILLCAQGILLKNTGKHGSSLQHGLRGLSCQLQARTAVTKVTCLGGSKLTKPSGKTRGASEQANCMQNWYLAKAPRCQLAGNQRAQTSRLGQLSAKAKAQSP